jgi:arginyl-tRNA synthetase
MNNKAAREIAVAVSESIKSLFDASIAPGEMQIQETRKEFEGEFTVVVFPLVKLARKSPEETGKLLGESLQKSFEGVESFSVVKGFLNLSMSSPWWFSRLGEISHAPDFGRQKAGSEGLILVEYASPNTNKPLHLGHLRNIFLGYSVSNILAAAGHEVKKVQIINDRGIHICKSMVAWQKFGNGETPQSSGIKGDHLVGKYYVLFDKTYRNQIEELMREGMEKEEAESKAPIMVEAREALLKWEQKDPEIYELWERMNGWVYEGFDRTYDRMGVDFDKLYYESDTWSIGKDVVLNALEKKAFFRKDDGSVWVDLTEEGLDEKLLLRRDGTAVYMTQDIGTAILRYEDFPQVSRMVYTVGNEQEYHFKVLFKILEKLGHDWARNCFHLSYGMVELPAGKMKSREGTVVDADDIMQHMVETAERITEELGKLEGLDAESRKELYEGIGLAALKYFLLKVDPRKNMLFNPEESIDFNGHTGPFIQYAHARIQSVLRNYGGEVTLREVPAELLSIERKLCQKLSLYPEVIQESAANYSPAILANYIFDLVKDFNSFYQSVSILHAENDAQRSFRAVLASEIGKVIKSGMGLLGIHVPDQM